MRQNQLRLTFMNPFAINVTHLIDMIFGFFAATLLGQFYCNLFFFTIPFRISIELNKSL